MPNVELDASATIEWSIGDKAYERNLPSLRDAVRFAMDGIPRAYLGTVSIFSSEKRYRGPQIAEIQETGDLVEHLHS